MSDVPDNTYAIESKFGTSPNISSNNELWCTPGLVNSIAGRIRIPNLTKEPKVVKQNSHFCKMDPLVKPKVNICEQLDTKGIMVNHVTSTDTTSHASAISIDPDNTFLADMKCRFESVSHEFKKVFNPKFKGYNGNAGPFQAVVNMGPVQPPQCKGRMPQYTHATDWWNCRASLMNWSHLACSSDPRTLR